MAVLLITILLLINRFEVRMYEWAKYLTQEGEFLATFVYFALVNINIIILLFLFFIIFRNLAKLIIERRHGVFGSQLRLKLVASLVLFSVIPSLLFFYLSYSFLTSSMDRWFSTKIKETIVETRSISEQAFDNERKQVQSLANLAVEKVVLYTPSEYLRLSPKRQAALFPVATGGNGFRYYADWSALSSLQKRFGLHAVEAVDQNFHKIWPIQFRNSPTDADDSVKKKSALMDLMDLMGVFTERIAAETVKVPDEPEAFTRGVGLEGQDYLLGFAPIYDNQASDSFLGYVVVQRRLKTGVLQSLDRIQREFASLKPSAKYIKLSYRVLLGLMTLIVLFSAIWAGFYVARNITHPIRKLALATKQIAAGNYQIQLPKIAHDETGVLIDSFNHMAQNLDQQKQKIETSQRELEERGRFTSAVLANVGSGVVSVDPKGNVSTVNKAVFEVLGILPREIEGESLSVALGAKFGRTVWAEVSAKLKSSEHVTFEVPYKDEKGSETTLGVYAVQLLDDQNAQIGSVIVFDDVTYQTNLQRVAAWKEVARRVAHEIKNPLTPIRLNAQRAKRKFSGLLSQSDRGVFDECMDSILSNVDQLTEIVEEFRKFSRMPSGQFASCDLSAEIHSVVENFRLSHPGVSFDMSAVGTGILVRADRSQMRQVFVNLVNNALAALEGLSDPKVALTLKKGSSASGQKEVVIAVADNGRGIPMHERLQVFEPYFTTRKEGTGLGLAIVNRIVNEHDGEIKIVDGLARPDTGDLPSVGIQFEIHLPEVT
jgi:two-component system nitrogen regulation sensor histidine kinase NtrY